MLGVGRDHGPEHRARGRLTWTPSARRCTMPARVRAPMRSRSYSAAGQDVSGELAGRVFGVEVRAQERDLPVVALGTSEHPGVATKRLTRSRRTASSASASPRSRRSRADVRPGLGTLALICDDLNVIKLPVPLTLTARRTRLRLAYWHTLLGGSGYIPPPASGRASKPVQGGWRYLIAASHRRFSIAPSPSSRRAAM
jgi:hypothetical protein